MDDHVGLQVFACVHQAGQGGSNTFLDGLEVARRMAAAHPEAFDFFCRAALPYYCVHEGVDVRAEGAVFRRGQDGAVAAVRLNNYDRDSLVHLTADEVSQFYEHLPVLYEAFREPSLVLRHQLEVGQMVIIDNWRVLHGREAFSGFRNLVGCYVGMDDFRSRWRVLEKREDGLGDGIVWSRVW